MVPRKVQVKLYAQSGTDKSLHPFIVLFHTWIQKDALGEMVFDVADYTHVPQGTGVLLVGHGSDYAIDQSEGRVGVLYTRKRDLPDKAPLLNDALSRALRAAELLNQAKLDAPGAFEHQEILFRFPDRLHLRNDDASFEQVRPAIEAALTALLPVRRYTLRREGEAREPLTVRALS
ncbi:MAG TPA: hypothetical protein VN764_17680 [Polyangiaceae bacterium]|nr:hypothetical protein [Polyangiaceae bacterium]